MAHKHGYYLILEQDGTTGIGECSYIEGLSIDDLHSYTEQLREICDDIDDIAYEYYAACWRLPWTRRIGDPSIAFGLETALLDLQNGAHEDHRGLGLRHRRAADTYQRPRTDGHGGVYAAADRAEARRGLPLYQGQGRGHSGFTTRSVGS
jgi:hypothetical protein